MKTLLIIVLAFVGGYVFGGYGNRVTKKSYTDEVKTSLNTICKGYHENYSKDGTLNFPKHSVSKVNFKLEKITKGNLALNLKDIQSLCVKKVVFK